MSLTLAFDVYGTLINTHGVVAALSSMVGTDANAFSTQWRDKQLEYAFRRGLMNQYVSFAQCTEQALDFTCQHFKTPLSPSQRRELMASYQTLPPFDDVRPALKTLQTRGVTLCAFSNGTAEAVEQLLNHAQILEFFDDIISVDDVQTFKPSPDVYHYLMRRRDSVADNTWLISSNPFDVIGANACNIQTVWVKRSESQVFDPWGVNPTKIVSSLAGIASINSPIT